MTSKVVQREMGLMERHIATGRSMLLQRCLPCKQGGFTYIGVLIIMAVMLVTMGTVAEVWHSVMQREKEQELLFVGHQFRTAIGKYYVHNGRKYPPSLEALIEFTDASGKKVHFLRKLYLDPMTGDAQWGLVMGQGAGVAGVYSLSEDKPYKTTGFTDVDAQLEDAESYVDWKFAYVPGAVAGPAVPNSVVNGFARPLPRTK